MRLLKADGADTVLGVSGARRPEFCRCDASESMTRVPVRREQGAGWAADH